MTELGISLGISLKSNIVIKPLLLQKSDFFVRGVAVSITSARCGRGSNTPPPKAFAPADGKVWRRQPLCVDV